jgi:hypothetical protein
MSAFQSDCERAVASGYAADALLPAPMHSAAQVVAGARG